MTSSALQLMSMVFRILRLAFVVAFYIVRVAFVAAKIYGFFPCLPILVVSCVDGFSGPLAVACWGVSAAALFLSMEFEHGLALCLLAVMSAGRSAASATPKSKLPRDFVRACDELMKCLLPHSDCNLATFQARIDEFELQVAMLGTASRLLADSGPKSAGKLLATARVKLMDQAHLSALALTLHVALACEDQVDCVATNVAGDELASLRVSAKLPLAEVRRRLAAEIGVVDVQVKLLLPGGGVVDPNTKGVIGELLCNDEAGFVPEVSLL